MPSLAHSRRLAALVAVASIAGVAASPMTCSADAANKAPAHKKLTKKERAKLQRQLRAELRRSPTKVFSKAFLKKADLVDFKLPLTVRLDASDGQGGFLPSDDELELDWDDSASTWPLAGGAMPAPEITHLSGIFSLEASFGSDATGYGGLGALGTIDGGAGGGKGGPVTISQVDPPFAAGPPPALGPP